MGNVVQCAVAAKFQVKCLYIFYKVFFSLIPQCLSVMMSSYIEEFSVNGAYKVAVIIIVIF